MLSLEFRLLARRFHGTPWDRNVNEGVPEWPPAPWRILRALVAAAHRLAEPPSPEALTHLLLVRLGAPPEYVLPRVSAGHTRHYMPQGRPGATRRVFDTFVVVDDSEAPVAAVWPDVDLSPAETDLLDRILAELTYLGRAETWVEARRSCTRPHGAILARPVAESAVGPEGGTRLLAAASEEVFASWRTDALRQTPAAAKLLPKTRFDALVVDTAWMEKYRWSAPPGSVWTDYAFHPGDVVDRQTTAAPAGREFTWALLHVTAPRGAVLPPLEEAVEVGDVVRRALMALSGDGTRGSAHPVFSGKDAAGRPLVGHRHAFVLPHAESVCAPAKGTRVDRVLVWARNGLDDRAIRALERLRTLRYKCDEGRSPLRLELVTVGAASDASGSVLHLSDAAPAGAAEWVSLTPFVPQRHVKAGKDDLVSQVRRALVQLGLPAPDEVLPIAVEPGSIPWHRFTLKRERGQGVRAQFRGHGFRLRFTSAVRGPVAIGYGAHYGLGLFAPVLDRSVDTELLSPSRGRSTGL